VAWNTEHAVDKRKREQEMTEMKWYQCVAGIGFVLTALAVTGYILFAMLIGWLTNLVD
jgi:hypothetical protein